MQIFMEPNLICRHKQLDCNYLLWSEFFQDIHKTTFFIKKNSLVFKKKKHYFVIRFFWLVGYTYCLFVQHKWTNDVWNSPFLYKHHFRILSFIFYFCLLKSWFYFNIIFFYYFFFILLFVCFRMRFECISLLFPQTTLVWRRKKINCCKKRWKRRCMTFKTCKDMIKQKSLTMIWPHFSYICLSHVYHILYPKTNIYMCLITCLFIPDVPHIPFSWHFLFSLFTFSFIALTPLLALYGLVNNIII